MSSINPKKNDFSALRQKAEEKLKSKGKKPVKKKTPGIEHELNVHKEELVMQNDELRATHLKLLKSIENYTELFDHAPVGYFILDENDLIINVNIKGCHQTGIDKKKLIGKHFSLFLNGEACQDDYYRHRNLVMETNELIQIESEIRKKNGTICSVLIKSIVIKDEKGIFKHLLSTVTDISIQKKMEDLLRENQLLLQSVFDNTSTIIIIKDLEGHFLIVNKQFEKIHNTHLDKLKGKTAYDLLPVELADIISAQEKNIIKNKNLVEEEALIRHQSDGSLHTYFSVKFPLVDDKNKVYSICTIGTDITEKKKYEKELSESKARLEAILENSQSSIWSINKSFQLVAFNHLHRKFFLKINNINVYLGMSVLEHMDSKTKVIWQEFYERALHGEHFSEEIIETISGLDHYFEISFNPIIADSEITGVAIFATDVTSRKKTEQQLIYKVNELNTFMYKATHDLRSPLASVLGLTKLAKEIAAQPELKQYFDMIDTSVDRMDKLLIDLVNIVNVSQGKLNLSIINFEAMVDEILESLSNRPNFSEIIFRKKITIDKLLFHSDYRLLYSVLQNIIDNAIKYRRDADLVDPIILIDISILKNVAQISITDNGIGIPSGLQDKVFDMFYRATTESTGTGLGLYIVKNTVEKLGGEIRLKSQEKYGTCVFITLPDISA